MSYHHIPPYCGIYYIPHINSPPCWLPQVSLSNLSKIYDIASRTILTQTFVNPFVNTSAKYTFPLYESCAVTSFRCCVGRRVIEGVVKEKEEASAKYKEAVNKGETAGLLEQHTPDVFSTSLGNIPVGETVKVEIEYITELKHDAEVDGLRFTIPTSVAPRYGDAPSGLGMYNSTSGNGMKISVQVTMPSNIRNVSSPSHTISMHLGGHSEDMEDDSFDPKCAVATLSQSSTELGKDFVLLVKCADLSSPRALLETHPTIPNSKALMVTLVPKFTLPPGPKPEIVFVVDRSGSMRFRIPALKSSLRVFLKSLPVGIKFNICSFGGRYSFLWDKSQSYDAETLEQAQCHVEGMGADFGGTEILPPIRSTVENRYSDLPLEIMVLTDGEVWNSGELFKYVEEASAGGDIRLFSLGIGRDVSHALVEGMARVGRGFSQVVFDETEGVEGKVVRMLRGGLSAHVKRYRLEWEGKPDEDAELSKVRSSSSAGTVVGTAKKINLFDTDANMEQPISFSQLPDFVVPSVIQAPHKLPPLFPFTRSTVYAILSADASPPSSVWLRGTMPSGDELELQIAVQAVQDKGQTIHQLAARKVLQELEEGTGYIHSGKYGVHKDRDVGTFQDCVKREGVRVGLKYGLASKWTSFLAVMNTEKVSQTQHEKDENASKETSKEKGNRFIDFEAEIEADGMDSDSEDDMEKEYEFVSSFVAPTKASTMSKKSKMGFKTGSAPKLFMMMRPPPTGTSGNAQVQALSSSSGGSFGGTLQQSSQHSTISPPPPPALGAFRPMGRPLARPQQLSQSAGFWGGSFHDTLAQSASSASGTPYMPGHEAAKSMDNLRPTAIPTSSGWAGATDPKMFNMMSIDHSPTNVSAQSLSPRQRTMAVVALQTFEGSFPFTPALASLLGAPLTSLEAMLQGILPTITGLSEEQKKRVWATLLTVVVFERELASERDVWELVVEKARHWMAEFEGVGVQGVERWERLVKNY